VKNLIVLCAVLLFTQTVFATRVGNGGFVIQCGSKVQLFDYYQAEQAGLHISPVAGNTLAEKVSHLLERLKILDSHRAENFQNYFNTYWPKQEEIAADALRLDPQQASDPKLQAEFGLGSITIPNHCQLVLAIQQLPPTTDLQFHHDLNLVTQRFSKVWNSLDLDTQAGLVVHELFYEDYLARRAQPATSESVRRLNGLLGASEISQYTQDKWIQELTSNHFTPMFPNFRVNPGVASPKNYGPFPDLVHNALDYPLLDNFKFWARSMLGTIQICQKSYDVSSSPSVFYDGLYPDIASFESDVVVDLSCYSSHILILNISGKNGGLVAFSRQSDESGASKIVINVGNENASFVEKYDNPNVKILGPALAQVRWDPQIKAPILALSRGGFSDIQVNIDGSWIRITDYCQINLSSGKVTRYR
jgi:hypothetical protein